MTSTEQATKIARMIDYALLRPEMTAAQINQCCAQAREYGFAAVCVNPVYVARCAQELEGTPVKVCAVVGFPLGANLTEVKQYEAEKAIQDGATEIDVVLNVGALKTLASADAPPTRAEALKDEVTQICRICHEGGAVCKVISEMALLTREEKVLACQLAAAAGADYVKTSTGFGPGGATVEDVALMRQTVGPWLGIEAAGGIRSFKDAQRMIEAGATRIGSSAGVKIVDEARES
jgi:deoxyribose-phosphate aldolase